MNSRIDNISYDDEKQFQRLVAIENRKIERSDNFRLAFRGVFFPPLSIAFKLIAVATKIIGSISALGIPIGIYFAYKVALQLYSGTPLLEAEGLLYACGFIIFPFIAFSVHFISVKIAEYFYVHRDIIW